MRHLLGAHVSISGGISKSIDKAAELEFTAIQIFTKNNNRWYSKPLEDTEVSAFRQKLERSKIEFVVAHDSYLINLCSANEETLAKSRSAFIDELQRCEVLGIPFLNFHPGAHGGNGEEWGIETIAESLNIAHKKTRGCNVSSMLELTAGQGTTLGHTLEQIAEIVELVEERQRMTVCVDTAHVFAAGYNIADEHQYEKFIDDFESILGLDKLKCLHMNDSKKPLGSKVDRHEHIGKGYIGLAGFRNIMSDKRVETVPKILETPKGKDYAEDLENIAVLKSLIPERE